MYRTDVDTVDAPAEVVHFDDQAALAALTLLGLEAIKADADRKSIRSMERFVGMIMALGFVHGVEPFCVHTQDQLAKLAGLHPYTMSVLVNRAAKRTGLPIPNGKSAKHRAATSAGMKRAALAGAKSPSPR